MDFSYNEDQQSIRSAVEEVCKDFDDEYWLKKDREGGFPEDFYRAMAGAGWLGIAMPTEYGGAGLGMQIVDKRVKNLYGEQYGLSVACTRQESTRVTLHLPVNGSPA